MRSLIQLCFVLPLSSALAFAGTTNDVDLANVKVLNVTEKLTLPGNQLWSLLAPFSIPDYVDGKGCFRATGQGWYYNRAVFGGSAPDGSNYAYWLTVAPNDLDTAVDPVLAAFNFALSVAETSNAQTYVISIYAAGDSQIAINPSQFGYNAVLTFPGDPKGGKDDVESIHNVTLTGWKNALLPGMPFWIRVARRGDLDASRAGSTLLNFSIMYRHKQQE